ncbi:15601_t:CDS:1, partial [Funneliformis geosporum]
MPPSFDEVIRPPPYEFDESPQQRRLREARAEVETLQESINSLIASYQIRTDRLRADVARL